MKKKSWHEYSYLWLTVSILAIVVLALFVEYEPGQLRQNYTRLEEGLWLGGSVENPPPDVDAVLNLCEKEDSYKVDVYRWQPIKENSPSLGVDWLREQVKFIEVEREGKHSVYVHCQNGANRSATVVAAYLMKREKWNKEKAIAYLHDQRPEVKIKPTYQKLLSEWEKVVLR